MFDNMKDEYDIIKDPWYSWLFSRLHYFIAKYVIKPNNPEKVLDIGCGTGFQSFLHAAAGSLVEGFDISPELIAVANQKKNTFDYTSVKLFTAHYDFVEKYNRIIKIIVSKSRGIKIYSPPNFQVADAEQIPFGNEQFDHINCCGAVLSFIKNYKKTIAEISRVLKRNGTFFIEVEGRWRCDEIWALLDATFKDKLGICDDNFKNTFKIITKNPLQNSVIKFATEKKGVPINLKMNLFTSYTLKRELLRNGLIVNKRKSIFSVINLIPYLFLSNLESNKQLVNLFMFLAKIENALPLYLPGYNIVVVGRKIK